MKKQNKANKKNEPWKTESEIIYQLLFQKQVKQKAQVHLLTHHGNLQIKPKDSHWKQIV